MRKSLFFEIICALLLLLFLYTAISKLSDFYSFRDTLHRSPIIENYSSFIAVVLPAAELLVSLLLFLPRCKIYGVYASMLLLVLFTSYLIYIVLFKSKNLPCSCGGVLRTMTWKQHIVFNVFFIALGISAMVLKRVVKPGIDKAASLT